MPPRMRTDALPVSHRPVHWIHLPEVDSTNDYVLEHADALGHGAVVTANCQRAGRGRRGRAWLSPEGNLYMTVLLRSFPRVMEVNGTAWLTLLMALSVCRAMERERLAPSVKWPNDVLLSERKIAGILAESVWQAGRVAYAAVGVGVNVNMSREDASSIDRPVAVLAHELGHSVEPVAFARVILDEFWHWLDTMDQGGVGAVKPQLLMRMGLLGAEVTVITPSGKLRGTVLGIDDRGALRIVDSEGKEQPVVSGEVI